MYRDRLRLRGGVKWESEIEEVVQDRSGGCCGCCCCCCPRSADNRVFGFRLVVPDVLGRGCGWGVVGRPMLDGGRLRSDGEGEGGGCAGPLTRATASAICRESNRSCEDRYAADGVPCSAACSSNPRHMPTLIASNVSRRASAATRTGRAGSRTSVCGGTVRSFRWIRPRTSRVPIRVVCPFTVSLRGVVSTRVLPDVSSVGERSAQQSSRPAFSWERVSRREVRSQVSSRACRACEYGLEFRWDEYGDCGRGSGRERVAGCGTRTKLSSTRSMMIMCICI